MACPAPAVDMVASGMTNGEILEAYPDLEAEDIREALDLLAAAGLVLLW